jgi:hypothetical protein
VDDHVQDYGQVLTPEVIRNIVIKSDIAEELDMQDAVLSSLVKLEEKGKTRYSDWEKRIKKNLAKEKSSKNRWLRPY